MKSISDIDHNKIVNLIKKGKSTPEIIVFFEGCYTRQQIAAIRAWMTMNKKNQRPNTLSIFSEGDKKRVIADVHKDLKTTIIVGKFNGKYTRQQVAAVRAWVTMGKY